MSPTIEMPTDLSWGEWLREFAATGTGLLVLNPELMPTMATVAVRDPLTGERCLHTLPVDLWQVRAEEGV
jgi:hypothetical protein